MAPDADKLRLQSGNVIVEENDAEDGNEIELPVFKNAQGLLGNLIAIDGIVFNLDGFNHPGGGQIKLFGGNDVTVQYKMIHPHHTGEQLKKLTVVGTLAKSDTEYQFDTPFERELKEEVFKIEIGRAHV